MRRDHGLNSSHPSMVTPFCLCFLLYPLCVNTYLDQLDESEGSEIKGRRQQQQQPATAALRALRADIQTYTEVGIMGYVLHF